MGLSWFKLISTRFLEDGSEGPEGPAWFPAALNCGGNGSRHPELHVPFIAAPRQLEGALEFQALEVLNMFNTETN